jgi:hypothetical protein
MRREMLDVVAVPRRGEIVPLPEVHVTATVDQAMQTSARSAAREALAGACGAAYAQALHLRLILRTRWSTMPRMTRFEPVLAVQPGSISGNRRNVSGDARALVMRAVIACALLSCMVNCSKGASTSSSPISASPPPTSSTPSSSSDREVNPALNQKTVVSRLDSAPAVAPAPSGPEWAGAGGHTQP